MSNVVYKPSFSDILPNWRKSVDLAHFIEFANPILSSGSYCITRVELRFISFLITATPTFILFKNT